VDKRLIYRVVLKILLSVALLVLLVVFVKSLFIGANETQKSQEVTSVLVSLDLEGMRKGEIRKIRLDGKEVAVLKRKGNPKFRPTKYLPKIPHPSLNGWLRSITQDYFVYYNYGDSGNCPLFNEGDGFKDTCTSMRFDTSGREKDKGLQGYRLEIPPHYFQDDKLFIGAWQEE